jgi:opacity protein-like surface antigen
VKRARGAAFAVALAATALAPRAADAADHRFRLGVGGGIALGSLGWSSTSTWDVTQETAELTADYDSGTGPAVEAMVGVWVTPSFGFRIAFGWSRRDTDATLTASLPHPFFFDRPRTVSGELSGLEYRQLASYLDLEWRPLVGPVSVAVFGGLALVRVEADFVERVEFDEQYPYDEATFRAAVTQRGRSDAGVGWSAGASVSHVLGSRVTIGLEARYTRANLELVLPGNATAPIEAGGLQLIAGLGVGF